MKQERRAVFLDRDGTLLVDGHYDFDPQRLELQPGVVEGLRLLQEAGYLLVIVTNQSGVARGYFREQDVRAMHRSLTALLKRQGITLTRAYYCPHHPEGTVAEFRGVCDCRKPQSGMLLRAQRDLHIDFRSSWLIGDILHDVEAGNAVGCRSVLIDLGTEGKPERPVQRPTFIAQGFLEAARLVIAHQERETRSTVSTPTHARR